MTHHRITEDHFFEQFKPVANTVVPHESWRGCLFDTTPAEMRHVQAADPLKVWTLCDCDGELLIQDGLHYVNRMGYFITEIGCDSPADTYEVYDPDYTPDEDIE